MRTLSTVFVCALLFAGPLQAQEEAPTEAATEEPNVEISAPAPAVRPAQGRRPPRNRPSYKTLGHLATVNKVGKYAVSTGGDGAAVMNKMAWDGGRARKIGVNGPDGGGGKQSTVWTPGVQQQPEYGPLFEDPENITEPAVPVAKNVTPWQGLIDKAQLLMKRAGQLLSASSITVFVGKQLARTGFGGVAGAGMIAAGTAMAAAAAALAGVATVLGSIILLKHKQKLQGAVITVSALALTISAIKAAQGNKAAYSQYAAMRGKVTKEAAAAARSGMLKTIFASREGLGAIKTGANFFIGDTKAGSYMNAAFGLYDGVKGLAGGGGAKAGIQGALGLAQTWQGLAPTKGQTGEILRTALTGAQTAVDLWKDKPKTAPVKKPKADSEESTAEEKKKPQEKKPGRGIRTVDADGQAYVDGQPIDAKGKPIVAAPAPNLPTIPETKIADVDWSKIGTQVPVEGPPPSPAASNAATALNATTGVFFPPGSISFGRGASGASGLGPAGKNFNFMGGSANPPSPLFNRNFFGANPPLNASINALTFPSLIPARPAGSNLFGTGSLLPRSTTPSLTSFSLSPAKPANPFNFFGASLNSNPTSAAPAPPAPPLNPANSNVLRLDGITVTAGPAVDTRGMPAPAAAGKLNPIFNSPAIASKYSELRSVVFEDGSNAVVGRDRNGGWASWDATGKFTGQLTNVQANRVLGTTANTQTDLAKQYAANQLKAANEKLDYDAKYAKWQQDMKDYNRLWGTPAAPPKTQSNLAPGSLAYAIAVGLKGQAEVDKLGTYVAPVDKLAVRTDRLKIEAESCKGVCLGAELKYLGSKVQLGGRNAVAGMVAPMIGVATGISINQVAANPNRENIENLLAGTPGVNMAYGLFAGAKAGVTGVAHLPGAVLSGDRERIYDAAGEVGVGLLTIVGGKAMIKPRAPAATTSLGRLTETPGGVRAPAAAEVPRGPRPTASEPVAARPAVTKPTGPEPVVTRPAGETGGAQPYVNNLRGRTGDPVAVRGDVKIVSPEVVRIESAQGPRDIIVVQTEKGPQAMYRSTGKNSGQAKAGEWLPFKGNLEHAIANVPNGWFDKRAFTAGENAPKNAPLHRYGTPELQKISQDLGKMDIPEGRVVNSAGANDAIGQAGGELGTWVRRSQESARKPENLPASSPQVSAEPKPDIAPGGRPAAKDLIRGDRRLDPAEFGATVNAKGELVMSRAQVERYSAAEQAAAAAGKPILIDNARLKVVSEYGSTGGVYDMGDGRVLKKFERGEFTPRSRAYLDNEIASGKKVNDILGSKSAKVYGEGEAGGTPGIVMDRVKGAKPLEELTPRDLAKVTDASVRDWIESNRALQKQGIGGADSPQPMVVTEGGAGRPVGQAVAIDYGALTTNPKGWKTPESFGADLQFQRRWAEWAKKQPDYRPDVPIENVSLPNDVKAIIRAQAKQDVADIMAGKEPARAGGRSPPQTAPRVDPARIALAEETLGSKLGREKPLQPKERQGVQDAHEVGNRPGDNVVDANGNNADRWGNFRPDPLKGPEVGNYTPKEIVAKGNILKEAGFKAPEIRTLIEKGVAGNEPAPRTTPVRGAELDLGGQTYKKFNAGQEGSVYRSPNGAEVVKIFNPTVGKVTEAGMQRLVDLNAKARAAGADIVPMEVVRFPNGQMGIKTPFVEGTPLTQILEKNPNSPYRQQALDMLDKIDAATGGNADRWGEAMRTRGAPATNPTAGNFIVTPEGRLVNIDPLSARKALRSAPALSPAVDLPHILRDQKTLGRPLSASEKVALNIAEEQPARRADILRANNFSEAEVRRLTGTAAPRPAGPPISASGQTAVEGFMTRVQAGREAGRVLKGNDVINALEQGIQRGDIVEGTFYRVLSRQELATWGQGGEGLGLLPNGKPAPYRWAGPRKVVTQEYGADGLVLVEFEGVGVRYAPGAKQGEIGVIKANGRPRIVQERFEERLPDGVYKVSGDDILSNAELEAMGVKVINRQSPATAAPQRPLTGPTVRIGSELLRKEQTRMRYPVLLEARKIASTQEPIGGMYRFQVGVTRLKDGTLNFINGPVNAGGKKILVELNARTGEFEVIGASDNLIGIDIVGSKGRFDLATIKTEPWFEP